MAVRRIVEVKTFLEPDDLIKIDEYIRPIVVDIVNRQMKSFIQYDYDNVTCALADVYTWIEILTKLKNKEIITVEDLEYEVGLLDTAARYPFHDAIERIELRNDPNYQPYT